MTGMAMTGNGHGAETDAMKIDTEVGIEVTAIIGNLDERADQSGPFFIKPAAT